MKNSYFIFILFFINLNIYAQSISEQQIKQLANKVDKEISGLSMGTDIVALGCISIGRTLMYQYSVPDNWYPSDNLKEELILNLQTAGVANNYFKHEINADFLYYNGSSLIKRISIKSYEFSNFNFDLGQYVSIKDHPKAKDVNLKLKAPIGWEVKEGDRPNIVKKFVFESNTFIILIKENATFFSRKEAKELLSEEGSVQEFISETSSFFQSPEVLNHRIVTLDSYPTLEFTVKGSLERSGVAINMIMKCWIIFYEDKFVFLQGGSLNMIEFKALEGLYSMVANSVIFPDQYN